MSATATKNRKARKPVSYDKLARIAEQPLKKRRSMPIGRNGASVVPRKHHLDGDEVAALTETYNEVKPRRVPNPHNLGMYFGIWESLILLGVDEPHPRSRVMARVEKILSDESTIRDGQTAWQRFSDRDARNDETGKDLEGRFDQNAAVLQRLTGANPYGRKMLDTCQKVCGFKGGVLDILAKDGTGTVYFMLNTKSDRPINQLKVRGMGSPADVEAQKESKRLANKLARSTSRKPTAKAKVADAGASEPVAETASAAS